MRLAPIALASLLALAGCGKEQAAGNANAVGEAVTAEDFVTNDATAIDAATGADANMAADVEINFVDNVNSEGGGSRPTPGASRGDRSSPAATTNRVDEAPAPEPAQPAVDPAESNSN